MRLTLTEAAHLARRSGFNADRAIVTQLMSFDTRAAAVSWLVDHTGSEPTLPEWHGEAKPVFKGMEQAMRKDTRKRMNRLNRELVYWWYVWMCTTEAPLVERMTLFWHNHFVSSSQKVSWAPTMLQQNQLFRSEALGNFGTLLRDILRDPAMLVYLDNHKSSKKKPNENFARELLELFTLGEGEYTETDVKEMARALTGASVHGATDDYVFRSRKHDTGEKTILGHVGTFGPDDIADIILEQEATALYVCKKLYREFVSLEPNPEAVEALAEIFRESGYEIKPVLAEIFTLDVFYGSQGRLIKSPVDLMVGAARDFCLPLLPTNKHRSFSRNMGQQLFTPPSVRGWVGGTSWYTTATLPYRQAFLVQHADEAEDALESGLLPSVEIAELCAVDPVSDLPAHDHPRYFDKLMLDPAYQVK